MALLTVAGSGGRGAAASDPWRQASAVPTAPAGAACSGQPHSTGGLRYCGTVAASVEPLPLIQYCFRTYGGATMAAHVSGALAGMCTNVYECTPMHTICRHSATCKAASVGVVFSRCLPPLPALVRGQSLSSARTRRWLRLRIDCLETT